MGKQISVNKFRGLVTNPNALTTSDGAMEKAENVNILQPDIITKVRGFSKHFECRNLLYIGGIYEFKGSIYGVIADSVGTPIHYALMDEFIGSTLINRSIDRAYANISAPIEDTTLLITDFPSSTSTAWKVAFGVKPRFFVLEDPMGFTYTALTPFQCEAAEINKPATAVFAGRLILGVYGTWPATSLIDTQHLQAVAQNRSYVLSSVATKSYIFSHKKWENISSNDVSTSSVPAALDCEAVPGPHPTEDRWEGGINPNCQVSYRVVFGKRYADGTVVLGAPSPISTMINPRVPCLSVTLSAPNYVFSSVYTDIVGASYAGDEIVYLYDWVGGTGTPPATGNQFTIAAASNNTTSFAVPTASFGAYVATGATLTWSRKATGYVNSTIPWLSLGGNNFSAVFNSFARLYRTVCSLDENAAPLPRFYMVEEKPVTFGTVSFVDTMPDAILQFQEELYTNEDSQDGEAQASNKYPELVDSIAEYRSCMFLGNPKEKDNISITQIKALTTLGTSTAVPYFRLGDDAGTTLITYGAHSAGEGSGGNQTCFMEIVSLVAGKLNLAITGQPYPIAAAGNNFVIGDYVEIYLNSSGVPEGRYRITASAGGAIELQPLDSVPVAVTVGRRIPVAGIRSGASYTQYFTGYDAFSMLTPANYWRWSLSFALQKSTEMLCKAINRTHYFSEFTTAYDTKTNGTCAMSTGNLASLVGSFSILKRDYAEVGWLELKPITNINGKYYFPDSTTRLPYSVPERQGTLAVSKLSEPEAFPLLNRLKVGSESSLVLGLGATRDSLIVVKEDGVFRVTGDTPANFQSAAIDTTVVSVAKGSICALNNFIMALTNQGVVQISDTGVQIISNPIENLIVPILDNSTIMSLTRAYASEVDRTYYLSTYTPDGYAVVHAYNYLTQTWTTTTETFADGVSTLNGRRFQLDPSYRVLFAESRQFLPSDYSQNWEPAFLFSGQIASGTTDGANVASVTTLAAHGLIAGDIVTVALYLSQAVNRGTASPITTVVRTVLTTPTPTTLTFNTTGIQTAPGAGAIVVAFSSKNAYDMVVATTLAAEAPAPLDTVFSALVPHVVVDSVLPTQLTATYTTLNSLAALVTFTWKLTQVTLRQAGTCAIASQGKVERAIESDVIFSPIDQSQADKLKQYSTSQVHFRNEKSCSQMDIAFRNDYTNASFTVTWKSQVFAGSTNKRELLTSKEKVLRTYVPLDVSVGTWIQPQIGHAIACEPWEVQLVSVQVETETDITTR